MYQFVLKSTYPQPLLLEERMSKVTKVIMLEQVHYSTKCKIKSNSRA